MIESISCPADVRAVPARRLPALAEEIRAFLIEKVSNRGGHLGPNLGVVELTLAMHRVFDSPRDRILWDTGHQAYVHKILTGRAGDFDELRRRGGLSGYPCQAESAHDVIENSHASTVLSYAEGFAKGYKLSGLTDRWLVAVIGDGALTGGMAWEALNNIGAADNLPLIIILNDNGRSYDPTVGGLARHLALLRVAGAHRGVAGPAGDEPAPAVLFEQLGLRYVGPIDGHDVAAVETALRRAVEFGGPVVVHCLTHKGKGYQHAEADEADRFHAVPVIDLLTGRPRVAPPRSWTSAFGAELTHLAELRSDVVAITAAMLRPTGLALFAERFPDRTFDVGIAEQHAVTSAAGLAMAGLRPVVAVYATFLNRAFDQVLMDVALHRCPVVFALDRAGVTGDDGASHNGMWDLSLLNVVPGLRIAAPRDQATLRRALTEALAQNEAPCVVRFPKGAVGEDIAVVGECDGLDVLRMGTSADVLIVSAGALAGMCLQAAELLDVHGIGATVVDPRWLKPVADGVLSLARGYRLVVTVEDGVRTGGFGCAVAEALRDREVDTAVLSIGLPDRFLDQGTRSEILADCGLTPGDIARAVLERISGLLNVPSGATIQLSGRF